MDHVIDAKNKKLGRLATEIAMALMGKNDPAFERNVIDSGTVTITNASQVRIDGDKMDKEYLRYSGYPGGLIAEKREALLKRKGISEIIRLTVKNMLPKNKHQKKLLLKLVINE